MLIDIHQVIDFLVEHVHVGQEIVVLLFSLYKRVLDLLYIREACGLFDGIEGLIDDLHISLIIINELNLFLIVDYKFS